MSGLECRSLYVRIVGPKSSSVHEHRVWNEGSRLLASLQKQYAEEGCVVTVISRQEYDAARFKKTTTKRGK